MVTWQLTINATDPHRQTRFWAPALGYAIQPPPDGFATYREWYVSRGVPDEELTDLTDDYADRLFDPDGRGPTIWFQITDEVKAQPNRIHLDLYPTERDRTLPIERRRELVEAKVAELIAAGASIERRTSTEDGHFVVMHDPEGNEFCVA